jgi:hypothetical protein
VTKIVTVILGQHGGPTTTSMAEALSDGCWSSTLLGRQVVRPRLSGGSQGLVLDVGIECSSILLSELGENASSSPALGDRGAHVLDCIFYFLSRVLFVKCKAHLKITRF